MLRSFTLIEILIAIAVLTIATFFISPVIFTLQDKFALNSEIKHIQSFIYQIQTKARYSQESYSISISQNINDKQWCIIAIKKETSEQIICDCLNINSCIIKNYAYLYKNKYPNIILKNKSLYPKSFISIDGAAGRLESKCINISRNKESEILQFDQWGRIYVMEKNKRSNCKD